MELPLKYVIALTNLYGIVHKDKVLEIYNDQNEVQITRHDLEKYSIDINSPLQQTKVYYQENYFIFETIRTQQELYELIMDQRGKSHFVPPKEELLNYVDETYFEKAESYYYMHHFLKTNFDLTNKQAEDACMIIYANYHGGYGYEVTNNFMKSQGIFLEPGFQENRFCGLYLQFSHDIRLWEDNGHKMRSPHFDKLSKPPVKEEIHTYFENRNKVHLFMPRKETLMRLTCKCGSGKRLKRCCGKQQFEKWPN